MDWTSVLEDTGEEDLIISQFLEPERAPRLERFIRKSYSLSRQTRTTTTTDNNHEEENEGGDGHRLWGLEEHDNHATQNDANKSSSSSYTLQALYYLTINYVLGVGCLGIPYAFARAGFILSSVIMITVTLLSYMTVMWLAETGARLERHCRNVGTTSSSSFYDDNYHPDKTSEEEAVESTGVATNMITEHTPLQKGRHQTLSSLEDIDVDRYEVVDLVSFYLGPIHKCLYQVSLLSLMYVGLIAFTQVFCGAIATFFWNATTTNSHGIAAAATTAFLPQIVFGVVVVPLSCMELEEQVAVQSLMATIRFVAIFIMVGGSILALCIDSSDEIGTKSNPPYFAPSEPENCEMSYTACFSGFGVAFSTALFSQLFQHSVPGLLRPLQTEKLPKVPRVFGASLLTTCSFYLLLGTTAASYFGADTKPSVNLNFANFSFGLDESTTPRTILLPLKFASSVVVMFPALDTLSIFPLIANTLGSSLMAASGNNFLRWIARHIPAYRRLLKKHDKQNTTTDPKSPVRRVGWKQQEQQLSLEERKELTQDATRIAAVFWRLVAAFPPLVASIWATDLSFSLLLAGVSGLYVAFFAPSFLQLASCRMDQGKQQQTTVFTGWYSWTGWTYPTVAFATFSLGVVLLQIRDAWSTMHTTTL